MKTNTTQAVNEIEFQMTPEQARLTPWFDRVVSKVDWKAPIKAFCRAEDMAITAEAIAFFTATEAAFEDAGCGWLRVTATGYRMGPAGDH